MQHEGEHQRGEPKPPIPPVKLGERELTTGLLSKNASFRLIVSGEVGVREIERLIAKLQLDKEILADPDPVHQEMPIPSPPSNESKPPATDNAGISWFITNAQKASLRKLGYTDEQIGQMKPEDAHKLLGVRAA